MNAHVPVLVVDHQPHHRVALVAALQERGYEVLEASTAAEAVEMITRTANLTLVVTRLELDGAHSAKSVFQQVGGMIQERGGLFLVTALEIPRVLPKKLVSDYLVDHEVRILVGLDPTEQMLPLLTQHLERLAG